MKTLKSPHQQIGGAPLIAATFQFLRVYWFRFLLTSAGILVPCFWHHHIEACDLASHVYNAWIAQLIKTGQAPGLWLAQRWNNVLFDFAVGGLGNFLGWGAAEKIATSGAVLIFFWGAFALVCAITRRVPWFILPCLGIFTYGWTFEMGFMNCYISFGLAFLALAIVVRGRGWERGLAAFLVPLIWLAHPLGFIVFLTVGFYVLLAEHMSSRHRSYLFVIAVVILLGIHISIQAHFSSNGIRWSNEPAYVLDSFNQLLLYGSKYLLPARLLRAFVWTCLLLELMRRRHAPRWWSPYLPSAELYLIIVIAVALLPTDIDSPRLHRMGFVSIGFLTERLTSVLAIAFCCLLGTIKPQKWHSIAFSAIAIVFFSCLYNDTAAISGMEDRLDSVVHNLPTGQRVVGTIEIFPFSNNVSTAHIIDRACIAHCFSYSNYEPEVAQFRVRASFGNPFVMIDVPFVSDGPIANYSVQSRDLPLFEIAPCYFGGTTLCVRELAAGNKTAVGFQLDKTWLARFDRISLLIDLFLASIAAASLSVGRRLIAVRKQSVA
jgi:hypothetical protein